MELSAWLAENGLSKVDPTMLTEEYGVEEADDLLHLEEPEIVQFTATLKPVQHSKFKKGLVLLGSNGAVAGLMTPAPRLIVAASASTTQAAAPSPAQAAPRPGGGGLISEIIPAAVLVGVAAVRCHCGAIAVRCLPSIKDSTLELLDSTSHVLDFSIPVRLPRPAPPRAAVLSPGARPG